MARAGNFLSATASILALGPSQPLFKWVPVNLPTVVKRSMHEAHQLPPPNVYIKNVQNYTFTPKYVFMAWCPQELYAYYKNVVMYMIVVH
jgi:hypothetical protein